MFRGADGKWGADNELERRKEQRGREGRADATSPRGLPGTRERLKVIARQAGPTEDGA